MHDPTRHELIELADAELDAVAAGQTTAAAADLTTNQAVTADIGSNGGVAVAFAATTVAMVQLAVAVSVPRVRVQM